MTKLATRAAALAFVLAVFAGGSAVLAEHVMNVPADIAWSDGPASLPVGARMVVLDGDPAKEGPFTMRLRLPADYRIPAHSHPADEHVTVISGEFSMGMGDKLDSTKRKALPAGSFAVMPARTNHFGYTLRRTVIQLHGMGPWGITYVNEADDPRKSKK
jgi:quercetin dioxygenase-like cupin family protein